MPYIPLEDRERVLMTGPETPGELNYTLIEMLNEYIDASGEEVNYSLFNEIVGVLESVKLEFYRRMVAPYEELKADQNGDVFNLTQYPFDDFDLEEMVDGVAIDEAGNK